MMLRSIGFPGFRTFTAHGAVAFCLLAVFSAGTPVVAQMEKP